MRCCISHTTKLLNKGLKKLIEENDVVANQILEKREKVIGERRKNILNMTNLTGINDTLS